MKLTIPGVDFAWGAVNGAALKAAGQKFGISYISHDSTGKNLSPLELHDLWAEGLFAGLVFEDTAKRALGGFKAGVEDATFAKARADALKPGMPVAFGVDFDVTPAQKAAVLDYLRGAVSVLGKARTGVYADYWVVKYLVENGDVCGFYWQTYAWSGGLVHERACVLQYSNGHTVGGLSVDFNHADPVAFTLFLRGPRPAPTPPTPTPSRRSRAELLHKIRVWAHHLAEARDVARAIGWVPALKAWAEKLKLNIAEARKELG